MSYQNNFVFALEIDKDLKYICSHSGLCYR